MPDRFFHDIKIEFLIHELKTPLCLVETAVRGLLEAREIYGEPTPKQEKTLHMALRNTWKIRNIISHLLEIGRSEAGIYKCRRFNPVQAAEEILADAVELIRCREENPASVHPHGTIDWLSHYVRVSVDETAANVLIHQDEVKFCQIISNLVKNALHHRHQWLEVRISVKDNRLYLEIRDDGPGIALEHHQIIFQRYTQIESAPDLARRGHGLGLAGARILARCLGGDIRIESEPNQGANFIVDLPLEFPGEIDQVQ